MAAFDKISNPSHYNAGRKYEPRKVVEDWDLNFYLGNALKYISRAGRKGDPVEDLQKAKQFIDFEIERLNKRYICTDASHMVTIGDHSATLLSEK